MASKERVALTEVVRQEIGYDLMAEESGSIIDGLAELGYQIVFAPPLDEPEAPAQS